MRIFLVLSAVLATCMQIRAQPPAPVATLKIFVLTGQDAVNLISSGTTAMPAVEVRDSNDLPVEGAQVIFELPANGPGGSFLGNNITFTTRTNAQGQAGASFMPNGIPGRFAVQVTATAGDRFGRISIPQTNSATAAPVGERGILRWSKKKWIIVAVIAASATVGIVLATRSSGNSTPTIVLSPGSPTFGGPQ